MIIRDENPHTEETTPEQPAQLSSILSPFNSSEPDQNLQILRELRLRQTQLEKQKVELSDIREELRNLRSSNSDFRRLHSVLTRVSPEAIIATDKNLNVIGWNRAAEQLFGWKAHEALDHAASPEIRSHIMDALNKGDVFDGLAAQGCWIGSLPAVNRDGQALSTSVSVGVLWDQAGAFNGLVAFYHEISNPMSETNPIDSALETKVKQRTEELEKVNRILQQELAIHKQAALLARESEGKNRDLVDNIKLGIFRCTPGPRSLSE